MLIEDDYILYLQTDKRTAIWIAHLSDNTSVYSDDGRMNMEPSAWKRLSTHVQENNVSIINVSLKFRSNKKHNIFPAYPDGVFFTKTAETVWGSKSTRHFYLFGYLKDGVLRVQRWKVPELILMGERERPLEKSRSGLILNSPPQ